MNGIAAFPFKIQPCPSDHKMALVFRKRRAGLLWLRFRKGVPPAYRRYVGGVYLDKQIAALFPRRGQPAESPWRLALATVLQFTEAFSDRQAADAVPGRIDWKYALGLELADAGFDHTVLSEFRGRLVEGKLELILLDVLLKRVQELGLLKQRTDSTHVLASVRMMNRLERVGETLRAALNGLALIGVPSENGPDRTLGHRGCRNPPIEGWDGEAEVAGHVARRYSAREQLLG